MDGPHWVPVEGSVAIHMGAIRFPPGAPHGGICDDPGVGYCQPLLAPLHGGWGCDQSVGEANALPDPPKPPELPSPEPDPTVDDAPPLG